MMLYVGPDQIIPVSALSGTLVGLALIFWNKLAVGLRRCVRVISPRNLAQK